MPSTRAKWQGCGVISISLSLCHQLNLNVYAFQQNWDTLPMLYHLLLTLCCRIVCATWNTWYARMQATRSQMGQRLMAWLQFLLWDILQRRFHATDSTICGRIPHSIWLQLFTWTQKRIHRTLPRVQLYILLLQACNNVTNVSKYIIITSLETFAFVDSLFVFNKQFLFFICLDCSMVHGFDLGEIKEVPANNILPFWLAILLYLLMHSITTDTNSLHPLVFKRSCLPRVFFWDWSLLCSWSIIVLTAFIRWFWAMIFLFGGKQLRFWMCS